MENDNLIAVLLGVAAVYLFMQKASAQDAVGQNVVSDSLEFDDSNVYDARDSWAYNDVPIDDGILDARDSLAQRAAWIPDADAVPDEYVKVGFLGPTMPWSESLIPAKYLSAIRAAESRYGLPSNLLARLLYQESRYRDDIINGRTRSQVGALGIAQFMPATARQFGIDPLNSDQAIDAAGKYLKQLFTQTGTWVSALAAYNWGIGNVLKKGIQNAPLETKNYYSNILADIGMVSTMV